MVETINNDCVSSGDKLTDNAYRYYSKNHLFETVEEYAKRIGLVNDEAGNQIDKVER